MRKVLSLLLCVAMLCSLVVFTAQADATPTASFASAVAVPGGSVTIDMNLTSNPGLASIKFSIVDNGELGVTYEGDDNTDDTLGLTANDASGIYYWSGSVNNFNTTFGTVTIAVPSEAEAGEYTFTVKATQGFDENGTAVALADGTFTITVTDKVITGVNVAIDAGISIGVHVLAADIDGVSITAVNVAGKEYATVDEYEEGEDDYIFYLNVSPWAMDVEFKVDFTDSFEFGSDEDEDEKTGPEDLLLASVPETAKTTGILSYCNALLADEDTSDELKQLIADLLEFGRQAQIYNGAEAPSYALPGGLTPTEAAWEIVDPEDEDGEAMIPATFADFCSENYPEDIVEVATGNTTQKNNQKNARKKFKFDTATINFGSKFVVTFTFVNNGTTTDPSQARVKVNGETNQLDGWNFTYAFSAAEYAGIAFDLYSATNVTAPNWGWTNTYGPAHFAAYLNDNYGEDAADILAILEAFYLYGASVEAYVATLGE